MILRRSILSMLLLNIVLFTGCSKSNSAAPKVVTTGSYTFQSETYNGNTAWATSANNSANINVQIAGSAGNFIIYNMPQASSGSFAFTDGYNNVNSATNLYAFLGISPIYATVAGGSITKTGAKAFTFSCEVYYVLNPSTKYTVTGSGTY